MKTRDYYAAAAERLADRAQHFTYGDGGDAVTGGALAAEALVYATLATTAPAAPPVSDMQLDVLREAVALMLHDADTSADDQAHEVIARFREGLVDTTYGAPVLARVDELMADLEGESAAGAGDPR
jgi:hypothetical protein